MGIPPFVIILILILAPMVLGALLKMFKAYQEETDRQSQRKRARSSVPTVPVSSSGAATGRGTGEIDRFLQEIDKLRQKADAPAKAVPVRAVPVAKAKPRAEPAPFVTTAPVAPVRTIPSDVPVARVVTPASPPPPRPAPVVGSTAPKVSIRQQAAPTTPFGKDLRALLSNNNSVALAVVLQEVLGPPKSRR